TPEAGFAAAIVHVLGAEASVMDHLGQVLLIGPTGVVLEPSAQDALSIGEDAELFVNTTIRVAALIATHEPHDFVVQQIAVSEAMAEKKCVAINPIGIDSRGGVAERMADFVGQFGSDALVGIHD